MTTQPKVPLLRMAKRDSISPRAAWGIRAAAVLLALFTGGLLLLAQQGCQLFVIDLHVASRVGVPHFVAFYAKTLPRLF